jgi:predicted MFS family arabinose efflux permease
VAADAQVLGQHRPQYTTRRTAGVASCARSLAGLDWLIFFLADIQTGFGPFVAIYLTGQAWNQVDIGLVLTVGGLVALAGQMPGGALIDAVRSARFAASLAVLAICASAAVLAMWPVFPAVMASRVLHAAATCVLGPAIAAISLGLVGYTRLGERLGRNARFASLGNGIAAGLMGVCGYAVGSRAIFIAVAVLAVPALAALACIRPIDIARLGDRVPGRSRPRAPWWAVFTNRRLIIFATCALIFQLANAAMLPIMGSVLSLRSAALANTVIAACVVIPQIVVVMASPWVGRLAQTIGRRPLLLICLLALAVRAMLFAILSDPYAIVAVQVLDGISAATLGVLFPLVVADLTWTTGRFNLGLGAVGSAVGVGAALSTTVAGYMLDRIGSVPTFLGLAGIATVGLGLAWMMMPETRSGETGPRPNEPLMT